MEGKYQLRGLDLFGMMMMMMIIIILYVIYSFLCFGYIALCLDAVHDGLLIYS
jgi:hypothetical protein